MKMKLKIKARKNYLTPLMNVEGHMAIRGFASLSF